MSTKTYMDTSKQRFYNYVFESLKLNPSYVHRMRYCDLFSMYGEGYTIHASKAELKHEPMFIEENFTSLSKERVNTSAVYDESRDYEEPEEFGISISKPFSAINSDEDVHSAMSVRAHKKESEIAEPEAPFGGFQLDSIMKIGFVIRRMEGAILDFTLDVTNMLAEFESVSTVHDRNTNQTFREELELCKTYVNYLMLHNSTLKSKLKNMLKEYGSECIGAWRWYKNNSECVRYTVKGYLSRVTMHRKRLKSLQSTVSSPFQTSG